MVLENVSHKKTTPSPIQKLPDHLINQIAAGEVVERPASIIKELVENSLDAGATQIEIQLKSGGMEEIIVTDNGWGMDASEIALAFERHATSKIQKQEDLEGILTFGFRGEALSSIASVSDVSLVTRQGSVDFASELTLSSGEITAPLKKSSSRVGTTIKVSALFSKVPARQKFLRTPATELSHCLRVLKEIALGNPECVFSLSHHERTLAQYTQHSQLERFKEVLRPLWEPDYFSDQAQGMSYEMFLSPISQAATKVELYLYINQRCIRNRTLLQAVKQAYQETFGPGSEPSGSVHITLRSDWVDPNVHPQKTEVRFLKQEVLFQWLLSSLRKKLAPHKPKPVEVSTSLNEASLHAAIRLSPLLEFKTNLKNGFILFEDESGLLITKKSSLRELLLHKMLHTKTLKSHTLTVPALFPLTEKQESLYLECKAQLATLGFETELFGEKEIVLKAVPEGLAENQVDAFMTEILSSPLSIEKLIKRLSEYATDLPLSTPMPELHARTVSPDGKPLFFRVLFEDLKKEFQ